MPNIMANNAKSCQCTTGLGPCSYSHVLLAVFYLYSIAIILFLVDSRLVPARPTVVTYSSDAEANAADGVSSVGGDALAAALAIGQGQKHRAVEVELTPVAPCAEGKNVTHRVVVRWVCPAHWRSRPPQREDGHAYMMNPE